MPFPKINQKQIENLASLRRILVRRMLKIVVSLTPFVLAFGIYRTAIFLASSFYNWRVSSTIIALAALVLAILGSLISGMSIETPIERLANSLLLSA